MSLKDLLDLSRDADALVREAMLASLHAQPSVDPQPVFLTRDEAGKIRVIVSDKSRFLSSRRRRSADPRYIWDPWRQARLVPLVFEKPEIIKSVQSSDFALLPEHLRSRIASGEILRTSPYENTSEYSVLMYAGSGTPPSGRTGTLFYKGAPVTVMVAGVEFLVEIKGVGIPDGNNSGARKMVRSSIFGEAVRYYGSLDTDQAENEFLKLETLRALGAQTFMEGNAPRAASLQLYDGAALYATGSLPQGYLIRLAPGSIRYSFEGHELLPVAHKRLKRAVEGLADQLAELLLLPRPLMHTCPHPENLIVTPTGYRLTDFSDVVGLGDLTSPYEQLSRALDSGIEGLIGVSSRDTEQFYRRLATNLGVPHAQTEGHPHKLFHLLWTNFFAPKIFEEKLVYGTDAAREGVLSAIERFKMDLASVDEGIRARVAPFIHFLRRERDDIEARLKAEGINSADELDEIDEMIAEVRAKSHDAEALAKYSRDFYQPQILKLVRRYLSGELQVLKHVNHPLAGQGIRRINRTIRFIDKISNFDSYDVIRKTRANPRFLNDLVKLPYHPQATGLPMSALPFMAAR